MTGHLVTEGTPDPRLGSLQHGFEVLIAVLPPQLHDYTLGI